MHESEDVLFGTLIDTGQCVCVWFEQMLRMRMWILVQSHQTSSRVTLQTVARCHNRNEHGEKWPMTMRYGFVAIVIPPLISRKQISLAGKYCSLDLISGAALI
jgi:hypothetical protein